MGAARNCHSRRDKMERISRRIDKYHRHPLANPARKAESQSWPSTCHRDSTSSFPWGLPSRSKFSGFSAGRGKGFWDTEREQLHHRMAHLKKVSQDPYGAIFGRRLDSYRMDNQDNAWPNFLRSFLNTEPAGSENPPKAHLQDFNFAKSPQLSAEGRQYDPISGRMAPVPPKPMDTVAHAGVECPPGSEVEAKFASEPLVEETAKEALSESIDCSGGSELEALFTTDPASFKNAQVMSKVPHGQESIVKPNIHVACSPGNELEALFVSESRRTEQPGAETMQVQRSAKKLDADAGLSSGANVECTPGNELEAMFAANPAARDDQALPLEAFDAQPASSETSFSVDCPPGNELDAKFATSFAGLGPQTASVTEDAAPSVDCSPGSELEAKIVSESMKLGTTVDCPPGSELEAKFIADPASAEHAPFQTAPAADHATVKKANVNIDCAPGNELEALFISDAASAGARSAAVSDVDTKAQSLKSKNLEFQGTEDRVGDFVKQNQSTKPSTWSSTDYRILAYDSSVSKVSTSEADSFFGTASTTAPDEILARLHNPAKFVPYFQQMQQDGYEIATGGGDILVFRRSSIVPKATSPSTFTEPDAAIMMANNEIAKFIRHDSDPSHSHSTFKVSV